MGGDEQGAVAVLAVLLLGQQVAAGEIVGDGGGHAQQDFGGGFGEPHVVLVVDVVGVRLLGGEAAGLIDFRSAMRAMLKFLSLPPSSAARYHTPFLWMRR